MNFLKRNLCFVLLWSLLLIIVLIVSNAVHEGIERIITQNQINNTYKIHK